MDLNFNCNFSNLTKNNSTKMYLHNKKTVKELEYVSIKELEPVSWRKSTEFVKVR